MAARRKSFHEAQRSLKKWQEARQGIYTYLGEEAAGQSSRDPSRGTVVETSGTGGSN